MAKTDWIIDNMLNMGGGPMDASLNEELVSQIDNGKPGSTSLRMNPVIPMGESSETMAGLNCLLRDSNPSEVGVTGAAGEIWLKFNFDQIINVGMETTEGTVGGTFTLGRFCSNIEPIKNGITAFITEDPIAKALNLLDNGFLLNTFGGEAWLFPWFNELMYDVASPETESNLLEIYETSDASQAFGSFISEFYCYEHGNPSYDEELLVKIEFFSYLDGDDYYLGSRFLKNGDTLFGIPVLAKADISEFTFPEDPDLMNPARKFGMAFLASLTNLDSKPGAFTIDDLVVNELSGIPEWAQWESIADDPVAMFDMTNNIESLLNPPGGATVPD